VAMAIALGVIVSMIVVGPAIWRHWTVNKFATDSVLLDLMLLLVFFSSLWSTSSVALAATNRHQKLAATYMIATTCSLGAAWVLAHSFGLRGVAYALIGGEIFMASNVLRSSLKFLGDTFSGFTSSMLSLPRFGR